MGITIKRGVGAIAARSLFYQARDGGSLPTTPLQFKFVSVDMRTAQHLNRSWHSMLPRTDLGNLLCGNTSVAYAALFEGRYYAVAIFSQPIIRAVCDGKTLELRRLAVCRDAPKYTASRMMAVGKIVDARPQRKRGDKNRATGPLQTKSRKQRWEVLL